MQHKASLGLAILALPLTMLSTYPAFAEEPMSKEIIAAKVRKQGYVCEAPKSAVPDPEITEPGAKGWMRRTRSEFLSGKFLPAAAPRRPLQQ